MVKNPAASTGDIRDMDSIPGSGRSPGWGHGNPLQYSCLKNPIDRGAWKATVHRVTTSQTELKWLSRHAIILKMKKEIKPLKQSSLLLACPEVYLLIELKIILVVNEDSVLARSCPHSASSSFSIFYFTFSCSPTLSPHAEKSPVAFENINED